MDIMQLAQMIQSANNPVMMVQQMAQNNPLFKRAYDMTNGKSENELRNIAQNLCQQKGMSPQQMNAFFHQFGI